MLSMPFGVCARSYSLLIIFVLSTQQEMKRDYEFQQNRIDNVLLELANRGDAFFDEHLSLSNVRLSAYTSVTPPADRFSSFFVVSRVGGYGRSLRWPGLRSCAASSSAPSLLKRPSRSKGDAPYSPMRSQGGVAWWSC